MMINFFIQIIQMLGGILSTLVIVSVILSYFLHPYHSIRVTLDRLVEPMLAPIRRVIPPVQMIDFSPIVLIILIQFMETLLVGILRSIG